MPPVRDKQTVTSQDVGTLDTAVTTPQKITTKAEAAAHIRSQPRRCRGKRQEDLAAVYERLKGPHRFPPSLSLDDFDGMPKEITTTSKAIAWLIQEGRDLAAKALNVYTRSGCGRDINEHIVQGPWDGEDHQYTCECGNVAWYSAPSFPDLTE